MNHGIQILTEFVKEARKWDKLTLEEQKRYLKKHPGSKRRLTAKPAKSQALETMTGVKRLFSRVKRLDRFTTRAQKKFINVKRNKIYWKLEKAITTGERPHGADPYNIDPYRQSTSSRGKENTQATTKINRLINRITDAADRLKKNAVTRAQVNELNESILNYIKNHYRLDSDIKAPRNLDEMKKTLKSKVKKSREKPSYIQIGHRVKLSNGVEVTVTGVKSGHKWTTVYGDTDDGVHWHSKQRSSGYDRMSLKYLGTTADKDTKRHVQDRRDFEHSLQDDKTRRKVIGRNKIEELGIHAGSKIMIHGTHYNWPAEVVSIDYRQGGVRINQMRHRHQRSSLFGLYSGPVTEHYRFIPASAIVSLAKGND